MPFCAASSARLLRPTSVALRCVVSVRTRTLLRDGEHPPRGRRVPRLQLGDLPRLVARPCGGVRTSRAAVASPVCRPHHVACCRASHDDNSATQCRGTRFAEASGKPRSRKQAVRSRGRHTGEERAGACGENGGVFEVGGRTHGGGTGRTATSVLWAGKPRARCGQRLARHTGVTVAARAACRAPRARAASRTGWLGTGRCTRT